MIGRFAEVLVWMAAFATVLLVADAAGGLLIKVLGRFATGERFLKWIGVTDGEQHDG